jgi:GNAT superfamily N-acetyltransferase
MPSDEVMHAEVLEAFDHHMRQHPSAEGPGSRVERDDRVVRVVSHGPGWNGVTWSDLDSSCVDEVIAEQISRFANTGRTWEWKHYSYDGPADLPDRLRAHGFMPEPPETLLVARIADVPLTSPPPDGVELTQVSGAGGIADLVRVHDEVFGGDHHRIGEALTARLAEPVPAVVAVVARAGGRPISSARMELHDGGQFASLWGGGTVTDWRRHGVFRALVAWRAAWAAALGVRYLQVDATEDSRPILERLGFVKLATTTPFVKNG